MFESSLSRFLRLLGGGLRLGVGVLVVSLLALGGAWAGPGSARPGGPGGVDPPPTSRHRVDTPVQTGIWSPPGP